MFNAEAPLSDYFHKDQNFYFDAFIDCSWPAKPSDQFKTWNTVVEHFKQQGHGKMILFSSIYGHKAPDFGMYEGTEIQAKPIEYAMLKAATEQATRYLAQKLKPWGIQVNCIAPGGVLNKESECFQREYIISGGVRMIETKNILPVVDMLLHPDNAVNGEIIEVSNGWTL
jgi:NAD(P)-dependent dehydrogenase (short-subunit alcohol dehydrogenase family)